MSDLGRALHLLREFVVCDAIVNYDSTLCWGCGEPKYENRCAQECLLERARKFMAEHQGVLENRA